MELDDWLKQYRQAWEERDDVAVAALFTRDAVYRSHPFREPHVGTAAIRAYWRRATSLQVGAAVWFGEPIVDGRRVAVEWWATMQDEGAQVTLPGCLVLRFGADGRCEELREYWHLERGRHQPHHGWGR
jgi:ketosteroid isomerase-like protein